MYQFFVRDQDVSGGSVRITGADAFHISNVLRLREGEQVRISTDSEESYLCTLTSAAQDEAVLKIVAADVPSTELPNRLHLFQGIPKKERLEYVIEKTTELGVYEIIPVRMKYCVAKIEENKAAAKTARLQAKAEAAAKQSKRTHVPQIAEPVSFSEAVTAARGMDAVVVPYENADGGGALAALDALRRYEDRDIAVFIGPEGGFAPEEIDMLRENSYIISLGKRILRTDTAAILTVGMLALMEETSDELLS